MEETKTNALDIINSQVPAEETETNNNLTDVSSNDFLQYLSLCYITSDSFKNGIGKPGEFILPKTTNLGDKINVVCLDYRIHASVIDDETYLPKDNFYVPSTEKRKLADIPEYQAFINQKLGVKNSIQAGSDLLFYIPEQNVFCVMSFRKTTKGDADPIFKNSRGGRQVTIHTIERKNRSGSRSWYNIVSIPTSKAIVGSSFCKEEADMINMPMEEAAKAITKFRSPDVVEQVPEGEAAPERER